MAPATSSGHTTRLLLEELSALLDIGPVVDITGEEKELHPDDVCDGGPSVRAVPGDDIQGLTGHERPLVEVVYPTRRGRFDPVDVMTCAGNVRLVSLSI